ncbi:MAG: hypothetical protein JWR19_2591, partial [Pedosphaera sp.]|nr:hypothetical protein [Pedosphaera sp.]
FHHRLISLSHAPHPRKQEPSTALIPKTFVHAVRVLPRRRPRAKFGVQSRMRDCPRPSPNSALPWASKPGGGGRGRARTNMDGQWGKDKEFFDRINRIGSGLGMDSDSHADAKVERKFLPRNLRNTRTKLEWNFFCCPDFLTDDWF